MWSKIVDDIIVRSLCVVFQKILKVVLHISSSRRRGHAPRIVNVLGDAEMGHCNIWLDRKSNGLYKFLINNWYSGIASCTKLNLQIFKKKRRKRKKERWVIENWTTVIYLKKKYLIKVGRFDRTALHIIKEVIPNAHYNIYRSHSPLPLCALHAWSLCGNYACLDFLLESSLRFSFKSLV